MHIYASTLVSGSLKLLEHENSMWLDIASIDSVKWLPADEEAIADIKAYLFRL